MKILALEPYYGGSHKAFLDGWVAHSEHEWTVFHLAPHQWKWRMHHAAVTFADQAREATQKGERWDAVFCSSMLDLATFIGLTPPEIQTLPRLLYFHENQLTYPLPDGRIPDYHYAFIHLTSGEAATQIWFNSKFHHDEYYEALTAWIRTMPNHRPLANIERMIEKSVIQPQGIDPIEASKVRKPGPLRILWAGRWEYDKNPEMFFEALDLLEKEDVDFRISVIGQQFRRIPEVFDLGHERWKDRIDHWGFLESKEAYYGALRDADIAVSTAIHEFFGVGIVEAAAAGAFPLVPNRLSYPEVLCREEAPEFFYEANAEDVAKRIVELSKQESLEPNRARKIASRFFWPELGRTLDAGIEMCQRYAPDSVV